MYAAYIKFYKIENFLLKLIKQLKASNAALHALETALYTSVYSTA